MLNHEGMCSFSLSPEFPLTTQCALHIKVTLFCVCVSVCMYWCFWSASSSEDIIHTDNFLQDPFSNSKCSDSYIIHCSSPGTYNVFMYCSWRNGFSDTPFPKIGTSFYRINTFGLSAYFLGYKIKTSKLFEMWASHINFLSVVRAVNVKSAVFWAVKLCKLIDRYWYFRAICSLHLQLQMVAVDCTPTSIHIYQITWHQIPEYRELQMSLVISIYCALSVSSTDW